MSRREKKLGSAGGKRRYDLPLNKGGGTQFLTLLIALMTFLAMLALAASFALSAMTERWSSGLENQITIEIPAEDIEGTLLTNDEIRRRTYKIAAILDNQAGILEKTIMSEEEIKELVKPWLGDGVLLADMPLPGLISLKLKEITPQTVALLEARIKTVAENARLDTHEEWLEDLLRFTRAMQFAALVLTVVIGLTTIIAVVGAVRSRMAEYHAEVELLHLMGATDDYISGQLQRHSRSLAFRGGIFGVILGILMLIFMGWIAGEMEINLLPDFVLGKSQMFVLSMLPVLAALIATIAARQTVLRVLAQMP